MTMVPIGSSFSFAQSAGIGQLGIITQKKANTLESLATGVRINRAADDPAGLISSEQLRSMLAELEAESRSYDRAQRAAAVADSALGRVSDLLTDAEALAIANANTGGLSDVEREANQLELSSILSAIDLVAQGTTFKDEALLRGSASLDMGDASVALPSVSVLDLGQTEINGETYTLADVSSSGSFAITGDDLENSIDIIRSARQGVVRAQAEVGAFTANVIAPKQAAAGVAIESVASAESAIRDTDYAKATAELARLDVLQQATVRLSSAGSTIDAATLLKLLGS